MHQYAVSVAIFAHNVAEYIADCIQSVAAAVPPDARIHVLVNGSSDETLQISNNLSDEDRIIIHDIRIGDKCNAWNYFVYNIADVADYYFFVDGDVRIDKNSIREMLQTLNYSNNVNAITSVPFSGRNRCEMVEQMKKNPGIAGNLYALPKKFIDIMKKKNISLPVGLVGDDSLIGALAATNCGKLSDWDKSRIYVCEKAGFFFDSLNPFRMDHVRLYARRLIRYSVRSFENRMVGVVLGTDDATALPKTARELHVRYRDVCRLRYRGLYTIFDMIALSRIKHL